ncbi:MAG: InlB B-repeat-containing protein [Ignavibacteriales bacterium]
MKKILFYSFILLMIIFISTCKKDDSPTTPPTTNPPQKFTVTVSVNPAGGGSVTGAGSYDAGSAVTLKAQPNKDYKFVNWTENSSSVSTDSSYSFTISGNRTLTANFISTKPGDKYTVTASVNPAGSGTVSGAGTYDAGTIVTLTAASNPHFTFVNWTENSNMVSTDSVYLFSISRNRTLVANFKSTQTVRKFTVNASVLPAGSGTVTGAGTYDSASTVTLRAASNADYQFQNWTENSVAVSTDSAYSFIISRNRTLVANFKSTIVKYTVSASVNPSGGGTVSGTGTFDAGSTVTLRAMPNTSYKFLNWTENSVSVSSDSVYSFTVTKNRSLIANFQLVKPKYTVTVSVNPDGSGTVSGAGTFDSGTSVTLKATANDNYKFVEWTENSNSVSTSATYTFTITRNRSLTANFKSNSLAGTWYGNYSGYDPNSKSNIDLMRHLIINEDNSYIDTLYGKPSTETVYQPYETETGSCSINSSFTTMTWDPSESKRINFSTKELETYTRGTHTDPITITDDEWEFYDKNLGVSYKLKIKK